MEQSASLWFKLATLLFSGNSELGIQADRETAIKYMNQAASMNFSEAIFNMAVLETNTT